MGSIQESMGSIQEDLTVAGPFSRQYDILCVYNIYLYIFLFLYSRDGYGSGTRPKELLGQDREDPQLHILWLNICASRAITR